MAFNILGPISIEAASGLLRYGILRLNLGYLDTHPDIYVDNSLLTSIQRLELRINISGGNGSPASYAFSRRY